MTQTQPIKHHKIIILLVFLCAAIMTSVFVFHASHQPPQSALTADEGMIFSPARDIKPFALVSSASKPFTQKDFLNHWTLLFFGFTHCNSICPTTLEMLNRTYADLQKKHSNLQVVFVSLDPERDSTGTIANYTQKFNRAFIGVSGKVQELRKLQSQLGVYSGRDESAALNNYQIQHTSSIMLISPQGKWSGFFRYGLNPQQFANAVDRGIHTLTRG